MKKIYLLLFSLVFAFSYMQIKAQACVQGTPNPAVWGSPTDFDFGLTIDAITTDEDTAVFVQGEDSTIYVQYLLPKKQTITSPISGTATVTSVQILGVSGMPIGLSWTTDAAAFAQNNTYYPQTYRYGVVSLCGTTFAAPGVYQVNVSVDGCGSLSGISACEAQSFPLYIQVLPGTGSGPIQMTPALACNSATVEFNTNVFSTDLVLNPETYTWTFHDATTQTGKPVSKTYSAPGNYPVKLTRNIYEYYISAASVAVTGGYNGDIEELFGGASDPYLLLNAGNGAVTTSAGVNDNTVSWTGLNIPISAYSISMNAWDEDNGAPLGTADDDLGTATSSFTSLSPGLVLGFNATNFTGTVTIQQQINTTLVEWDTVKILSNSVAGAITASNGFTICAGDSTVLDAGTGYDYYQWHDATGAILNANNQTLTVNTAGTYSVEVLEQGNICPGMSSSVTVSIQTVSVPVIQPSNGTLEVSNPSNFNVQWFNNGAPITNETNNALSVASLSLGGPFTVSFTNSIGCSALSSPYSICIAGTSSASGSLVSFNGDEIDFTASNFTVTSGNIIAWAVSTEANGPITNQTDLQTAISNGWVYPSDDDSTFNFNCGTATLANGNYYLTPFTAEAIAIDPVYYNPNEATTCNASMNVCLTLTGSNYSINPLLLVVPSGDTVDVIAELAGGLIPPGTPITPTLWSVATSQFGDPVCIDLIDVMAQYVDDPNGEWYFILPNNGTGALNFNIDAFDIIVEADSCNNLATDQITPMDAISGVVNPNSTGIFNITVPPLPSNFPSIASDCETFGSASAFTVYCTDTNIIVLTPDTITFQLGDTLISATGDTIILDGTNGLDVLNTDSFYVVENGNTILVNNVLGNNITVEVGGTLIYTVETGDATSYTAPTVVPECLAGIAISDGGMVYFDGSEVTLTASDFTLLSGNSVAWAFSTQADGPITTTTQLQAAIAAGMVLPGNTDTTITLNCSNFNFDDGTYYATPFTAQSITLDTSAWNPFAVACTPEINICIGLSGSNWEINPLLMVVPSGDTIDVIAELAGGIVPPGTPINPSLWGLATAQLGDPACLELVSMMGFNDNPNGTWSLILPNTGTGALNIAATGLNVSVYTDSCNQISNDYSYDMPSQNLVVNPGSTEVLSFEINLPQPPPLGFPNIIANCDVIGDAVLFEAMCTDTAIAIKDLEGLTEFTIYPNPNTGKFNLALNVSQSDLYSVRLTDISGKVIYANALNLSVGKQTIPFNMDELTTGLYFFTIGNTNGQKTIKVLIK